MAVWHHTWGICGSGAFFGGPSIYNESISPEASRSIFHGRRIQGNPCGTESEKRNKKKSRNHTADDGPLDVSWQDVPHLPCVAQLSQFPDGTPRDPRNDNPAGFLIFTGVHRSPGKLRGSMNFKLLWMATWRNAGPVPAFPWSNPGHQVPAAARLHKKGGCIRRRCKFRKTVDSASFSST